jgi:hypothetical protein
MPVLLQADNSGEVALESEAPRPQPSSTEHTVNGTIGAPISITVRNDPDATIRTPRFFARVNNS